MTTVLIVDDHLDTVQSLKKILEVHDYRVVTALSGKEALQKARDHHPDVILLDVMIPDISGFELCREWRRNSTFRFVPILLVTACNATKDIVIGFDHGADDYVTKPFLPDELLARIRAALRVRRWLAKTKVDLSALEPKANPREPLIIGHSEAIKSVLNLVQKVANVDSPVLITGPTGVGKELVAKAIHARSARSERPFVAQNCAAFQDALLESELFGYVRGAFTGADRNKVGLLEAAGEGTILLDEIGELSSTVQAKLLRVIQEGMFIPLGSVKEQPLKARLLAATNRNLEKMVEAGTFREDLYYRLDVISIHIPALRERREDIPLLLEYYLNGAKELSAEALAVLAAYSWRGNVRELRNEMQRLIALSPGERRIEVDLVSPRIRAEVNDICLQRASGKLREAVQGLEKELIVSTLLRLGGNKSLAAKELGISRGNLIAKTKRYGLSPRRC